MFDAMIQEVTIPLGHRRSARVLHRRHQRDDERGVRLLRRAAAGQGARAVRAPAVRTAALVHLRRPAVVRRRGRSARRHDDDPAEGRTAAAVRSSRPSEHVRAHRHLPHRLEHRGQRRAGAARQPRHRVGAHVGSAARRSFPSPSTRWARRASRCAKTRRRRRCASSRAIASRWAAAWSCRCRSSSSRSRARLGYRFRDRGLLEHALTHKSKAHEDPSGGVIDNESLEFLGDAVLGLVIADALCRTFPDFSEGQKSKIKAMLVSTRRWRSWPSGCELGEHMILGRGEEKTGGRPQAGAAGRHLRGADRGDLSRRRPRAGAPVHPARAGRRASKQAGRPDYFGRDHKSRLQEALQGLGPPAADLPRRRRSRPGAPQAVPRRSARRRRSRSRRGSGGRRRTPNRTRRRRRCETLRSTPRQTRRE